MKTYAAKVNSYEVREEVLNNTTYMVVPVTMMVEGVHNGSRGPIFHSAAELGKIVESWNGIPVTIGHPMVDNAFVPANSPQVLQEWGYGIVFNAHMSGVQLKAEAWIEKAKLQANNENLHDRIMNGEIIEVSVGVFSDEQEIEGTWHNETYRAVAYNFRPEHLALLPNQQGACSVNDGCGIRVNNENMTLNSKNVLEVMQQLKQKGVYLDSQFSVSASLMERVDKVRSKLYSMDTETMFFYIEDVDETFFIYRKHTRGDDESTLYKQGYGVAADGSIEFIGQPVQVVKRVEYDLLTTNKVKTMANEKCTPCVKKKVNALIANTQTKFAEEDREWLENLEEFQLDSMVPNEVAPKEVEKEITHDMAVNALGLKEQEDYLKLMPESMQASVRSALTLHETHKKDLVAGIIANTEKDTWTEDELNAMEVNQLEKLAKTAKIPAQTQQFQGNFAAMGAGTGTQIKTNGADGVPPMAPAGINFETK